MGRLFAIYIYIYIYERVLAAQVVGLKGVRGRDRLFASFVNICMCIYIYIYIHIYIYIYMWVCVCVYILQQPSLRLPRWETG